MKPERVQAETIVREQQRQAGIKRARTAIRGFGGRFSREVEHKLWQAWEVRLYWVSGRSTYERGRSSAWPVGTSAMQVLRDVASDSSNGCNLDICTRIEIAQVGAPFEMDAPKPEVPR